MSQLEKLVAKFLGEPTDIRFGEVNTLLQHFGYTEYSAKGSHYTFVRPGARPITVPTDKGRRVKRVYIRRINELLQLEEWYEQRSQKES